MPTSVTFNGSSYSVPSYGDSGWAQGAGNLSTYLVAIASGTLQTTGGSFTLSADANFGSSFGIIAPYLKSSSASIATAGVIRLAIGDTIDWGTSNLALSVSGTTLMFNGTAISQVSLPVSIANGGTGQTTQQAAIDALAGAQTSGQYLRGNGTHVVIAAIQAGDVPTLNQNTTGSSGSCTGNSATATTATSATNISGGAASQIPYQTGSGATSFISNGTSGQILTSNGASAPSWANASSSFPPVSTRQVLTSGSGATYTTPANVRQLKIRMVGGGGGGGCSGSAFAVGGNGGDTIFNSIHAAGGKGGGAYSVATIGGQGGTGGSGTASFRSPGGSSVSGTVGTPTVGGDSLLGGGAPVASMGATNTAGVNAAANSGGGGSGAVDSSNQNAQGGGGGEYVELIINSPSGTYTYTVGAAGTGSTAGSPNGGNGGSGVIIVDELY